MHGMMGTLQARYELRTSVVGKAVGWGAFSCHFGGVIPVVAGVTVAVLSPPSFPLWHVKAGFALGFNTIVLAR